MRRIAIYIYQQPDWPHFRWRAEKLVSLLSDVRYQQGRLLGRMESLGFQLQTEATLQTLTLDVLKSSEIEGEVLDREQVRSSIARRLGIDVGGLVPATRDVEGIVEMMLDATQNSKEPLTKQRLADWHAALFPTGRSGMHKIVTGAWRNNARDDPMQVVSGAMGKEKIHFQAPDAEVLEEEMQLFCNWFNAPDATDAVIKAALAHLWFVSVHPFDDGNGRIARAITDLQLCRADDTAQRFYSLSAQIKKERNLYYDVLEKTQKGTTDVTVWLEWFLGCTGRAIAATNETLGRVLRKARFWERHAKTTFNERQVLLLNKLLDGFEGKLTSGKWSKMAKVSQDTALRDIQNLMDRAVLVKEPSGGRSTGYVLAEE